MRRILLIIVSILTLVNANYAQLTGTKNIPGNYASVESAIADLNSQGVGSGGVIFNIAAGYKETFLTSLSGYITTTTGSVTNPVTFQRSGAGINPLITAPAGLGTMDAIFAIAGCDYVTFNGIDVQENAANSYGDPQMEWGFAILKASGTDGSQHITIKKCKISLDVLNSLSTGIHAGNHTTVSTSELTVTAASGTNSFLQIFSDTISNCYNGISISGFNAAVPPNSFYDQNNEIGTGGANVIRNVGGGDVTACGIYTKYQNNLKVANNRIVSEMVGTQPHYGIFLSTAINGSYDLFNNYVSMQFWGDVPTASFFPVYSEMGESGLSNTMNIYNNTVTGCTFPTAAGGSQYTYYMYFVNLGVTANVYGNVVSNNIVGDGTTTANGRIYYLYANMSASSPGTLNLHDNSVTGNSRVQSTPGGGLTTFLGAVGSGSLLNMYNNTVSDNVVAASSGTNILYASFDVGNKNIYNNTVSNITQAEGLVYGLFYSSFTSNSAVGRIFQNKIQNIEGITTGVNIYGIYVAAGNKVYVYNNYISNLRAPAASSGTHPFNSIDGINIGNMSGATIGVYNNTVYLAASSTGTNFATSAMNLSSFTKVDSRNNILVNNSVPSGLGKTVAIRFLGSSNLSNYASLSNYNDLYAGTPGASHLILSWYNNSALVYTEDQTLEAYKTRMSPREAQSVTEIPPFVNVGPAAPDLHLQTSIATQCESGGTEVSDPLKIQTDFDNNARFPNAGYPVNGLYPPHAPDIGADETAGIPIDIVPPAINFTPLQNIANGNQRILTTTITDGSGVPASGIGLPVLYWQINTGTWHSAQAVLVGGGVYTFAFGAGTVTGDVVHYYIAAQDLATTPNVGVNPAVGASGYSINPPACSALPSIPYSYTVMVGIAGTFHVGVGKDFSTLTNAAAALNTKCLDGPVTLILDDATYPSEVYPVALNANSGSSQTNTVTIKPNTGISPVFTANVLTGIFNLNGIDYLTIDGSNSGTNSKNMTIRNTSRMSGTYAISVLNQNGNDPATNVTIRNCIINCTPPALKSICAISFSETGGGYDNFTIDNNTIAGAYEAIRFLGSSTGIIHNGRITNNIFGSMSDTSALITHQGIVMQYADNTLISGNEIIGPYNGSINIGQTGIALDNGCTNTKITGNRIHDFYHPEDNGWGVTGIWFSTADASTVTEISNNVIYNIKSPGMNSGVGQNICYGMFFRSGGNVKILNNTIYLSGPFLSSQYEASSACLGFYYQVTGHEFEVRNNILKNSMVCTGTPNIYGRAYGIMVSGAASMFSIIDNNDFYINGYNGNIGQQFTNVIGAIVNFPTLTSWQTFTGQEAHSITTDPVFTSETNLIPTTTDMNNAGSFISSVPADITGINRSNPPDMGAYEFAPDPIITTTDVTEIGMTTVTVNGTANATNFTCDVFFDYGSTSNYGSTVAATPAIITGNATSGISANITGLLQTSIYHFRARGITSTGLTAYGNDMTFTTMGIPADLTSSGTVSTSNCYNATNTITVAGGGTTFTVTAPSGSANFVAGNNILFEPGTTVQPGGYMHGVIYSGTWCGMKEAAITTLPKDEPSVNPVKENSFFTVYPNPTNGSFTLEILGVDHTAGKLIVEIINMRGDKIFQTNFEGNGKHDMTLSGSPSGIYLIRVISGGKSETARIIKI